MNVRELERRLKRLENGYRDFLTNCTMPELTTYLDRVFLELENEGLLSPAPLNVWHLTPDEQTAFIGELTKLVEQDNGVISSIVYNLWKERP